MLALFFSKKGRLGKCSKVLFSDSKTLHSKMGFDEDSKKGDR